MTTQTIAIQHSDLQRRITAALAALAVTLAFMPAARALERLTSVIVSSADAFAAAEAVETAGGSVTAMLPVADAVAARVPEHAIASVARVASVVADRPMRLESSSFAQGSAPVTAYPYEVGATSTWASGNTGAGVSVALVDTGVADVEDLGERVIARADLSGEDTGLDGYGHGTFLAGLIAGNGSASGGRYVGVAPSANLVSIKVASADGSTNLSKVLAGVQLARSSASLFNTRVLVLAVSSESPMPPDLDPLSRALRRVWASGIVVVVPAGNDGPAEGTIASPGEDPVLLTIGSVDDQGTAGLLDDTVSEWSSRGETRWGDPKPDVAAPGEHLIGLRSPGSTVDRLYPGSAVESAYFRGSGTSMAAAVAGGAAALLLAARPTLSADRAKAILMGTANPIPAGGGTTTGAGIVNAADAIAVDYTDPLPSMPGDDDESPSDGAWEPVGSTWVWRGARVDEISRRAWAERQWADSDWQSRQWAARQWTARQWVARQWASRQWASRQWASRQWAGSQWASRQWSSRQWAGRQWTEEDWLGRQWVARQWTQAQWEGRQWEARQWTGRQWTGRQWTTAGWA